VRKLIGLVIVLVLILALFSSPSVSASAEVEEELLAIGTKFEQAFETGDLKIFEELFWHDERLTVFFPDPDTAFRIDGWSQLQGLLEGLTYYISQLPPGAVNMEIRQPSINVMEDVAILTSYWIITMPTPEGGMEVMQGRSTMVCKKIEGKWVIIHAHESIFPTP
jgi:ketosteroid isomerase-like protein